MSFKQVVFYLGCTAAWFILLPVFVIGGGLALLAYAILGELGEYVIGGDHPSDDAEAREIAKRMCVGH